MKASRHIVAGVVAEKAVKAKSASRFSREVAAYLLSERRTNELAPLLRDVQQSWADTGSVNVKAVSAHALSATAKRNITARVRGLYPKAKRVIIIEELDPAVLGGVRLELANEQLDVSARAKLDKFKQLTTGKD